MDNPYSTPSDLPGAASVPLVTDDHPICFQGQVTPETLRPLFHGKGVLSLVVAVTAIFLLITHRVLYEALVFHDPWILAATLVTFSGLCVIAYDGLWNRMGGGMGRRIQKLFPWSFEDKTGRLTEHWLSVRTANKESHILRSVLRVASSEKDCLWLIQDQTGLDSLFFMRDHFGEGEFDTFKEAVSNQPKPAKDFFEPNRETVDEILQRSWPENGVLAEGVILRSDFFGLQQLRSYVSQSTAKVFLWFAYWMLCFACAAYVISFDSLLIAVVLLGVSYIPLLLNLWKRLALAQRFANKDTPLRAVRAMLHPDGVSASSRFSTSDGTWACFADYFVENETLVLRLPGEARAYVLLPRRFFASAEDWDRALSLIEQNLPLQTSA